MDSPVIPPRDLAARLFVFTIPRDSLPKTFGTLKTDKNHPSGRLFKTTMPPLRRKGIQVASF
jgi:hypothetical protein